MGAGHDHGGPPPEAGGTAAAAYRSRLRIALGITLFVLVTQVVGGLLADSLALLADAGHMATDALGLGMALLAIHFANRPASERRTFGFARAEILAALANCLLLLGVGGYILFESVERFIDPAPTDGGLTIVFGAIGLVANIISLSLLLRGQKESINVRGAFLEVLADALGSLAVLISAAVVLATGWLPADPIASLVIGAMIVPRTLRLAREALDVLLESAPRDVDLAEVRDHILAVDGVNGLHDLHVWTITSGMPVLSAHVVVDDECIGEGRTGEVLDRLCECLGAHFDVEHCTFQLEPVGHQAHEPAHHA